MMKTPLYEEHRRLGAQMTNFAGWEMPLLYSSIVGEVLAVRRAAGLFDLSHMGELIVEGKGAFNSLQRATTNDVSLLGVGDAQYTLMCGDEGGILDDLILYRLDLNRYMLVTNAANKKSDYDWLEQHSDGHVKITDRSSDFGMVAIQGPGSEDVLKGMSNFDLHSLPRFGIRLGYVSSIECWVARTGYTGEDGFELYCSANDIANLWRNLLDYSQQTGLIPAGLGARDVLRLEAGYPLYSHELNRAVTPVEARLLWAVKRWKSDFIGKEAIWRRYSTGPQEVLVGLELTDRCIPRHGHDIYCKGHIVGHVTSGTFSPTLKKAIGMAYVKFGCSEIGRILEVKIRERYCPCTIVDMPFYRGQKQLVMRHAVK